jgi:hypothetical protein
MGAETSLRPLHHARIYEVERGGRWLSIGRKETAIPAHRIFPYIFAHSEAELFKDIEDRISMKVVRKPAKFKLKSRIQG